VTKLQVLGIVLLASAAVGWLVLEVLGIPVSVEVGRRSTEVGNGALVVGVDEVEVKPNWAVVVPLAVTGLAGIGFLVSPVRWRRGR
jgi:hypothetical protein